MLVHGLGKSNGPRMILVVRFISSHEPNLRIKAKSISRAGRFTVISRSVPMSLTRTEKPPFSTTPGNRNAIDIRDDIVAGSVHIESKCDCAKTLKTSFITFQKRRGPVLSLRAVSIFKSPIFPSPIRLLLQSKMFLPIQLMWLNL